MKNYLLKKIKFSDFEILYEWANDPITRLNSFKSDRIDIDSHKEYIKNILNSKSKNQYIFYIDDEPRGTIKEFTMDKNLIELSYTVSPKFRNKSIGSKMLMNYLEFKKGTFICKIKESNIASTKMVEKCGFTFLKKEKNINYYFLKKK